MIDFFASNQDVQDSYDSRLAKFQVILFCNSNCTSVSIQGRGAVAWMSIKYGGNLTESRVVLYRGTLQADKGEVVELVAAFVDLSVSVNNFFGRILPSCDLTLIILDSVLSPFIENTSICATVKHVLSRYIPGRL